MQRPRDFTLDKNLPMLDPSASRFWQAATQSGLIAPEPLQACWDSVPPEKRQPDAIDRRVARQAVQAGLLTLWQAQQLMTGRSTGFKIDRYVLMDLIGQGGMGRVYLGRDTKLNRKVALKILSPERMNNERARERFHREAVVGAQLQHEHLVRIYDEGEAAGKCYLVMEYIEGKNIGQMIAESGTISYPVAARLGMQVALGLEHAHRKGLIHRDVNPYNILVTRDGQAKLTDLGLALDLADTERVTRDGATVGTFDYVSPEQARHSHDVDSRSDIYSLGCSLYHMITGNVPFPSTSLPEKLFGHQAAEPEPIGSSAPNVPAALVAVIDKMMRKSRDDRYATPFEVAQALGPFADDSTELAAESVILGGPIGTQGARSTDQTITNFPVQALPVAPVDLPKTVAFLEVAAPDDFGGLGLSLDLGPPPSLSSPKSKGKAKPKATESVKNTTKATSGTKSSVKAVAKTKQPGVKLPKALLRLLPPLAGGLVVALLAFGFLAYQTWKEKGAIARREQERKAERAATVVIPPDIAPDVSSLPAGPGVVVVAGDGTPTLEPDFASALTSAIGSKGYVVLSNKEPFDVPYGVIGNIGGGTLAIRAAKGPQPVLRVEIKGRKPFLTTRGDSRLKLEGITIEARYIEPDAKPEPNPVIDAGGSVSLTRCAFRLEGKEVPPSSRAVLTQGGGVTVKGTSFENFGRAFDMIFYAGTTATFTQCLFLRTIPPKSPVTVTPSAIGARVSTGGTARLQRKLQFDRCTVIDQSFLALRDFAPRSTTKIVVNSCAIRASTLMTWGAVALPSTQPMDWSGKGNRYDIKGENWIVLAPKDAAESPMPGGPGSLDAWNKLVGNQEVDSTNAPIKFASDPDNPSERPGPSAFEVLELDPSAPLGADPREVGPLPVEAPRS